MRLKRRVIACVIWAAGLASCRDAPAPASSTSAVPTYTADIVPILSAKCAGCHRPGQGAPFTLLSYQDAQKRARAIADVTSAREMPPWLPEPNDPPFIGERRLSAAEIATLRRWAETGAAEGEAGCAAAGVRAGIRVADRHARSRPASGEAVPGETAIDLVRQRRVQKPRDSHIAAGRSFCARCGVQPRHCLDSPCRPASRSDVRIAAARRPGRTARVRRHGRPWNGGARWTLRRLGARTRAHRLGGRQAVASRAQHRSGSGASSDSRRKRRSPCFRRWRSSSTRRPRRMRP